MVYVVALFLFPKLYVAVAGIALILCFTGIELARFRAVTLQRWLGLRLALFLRSEEERRLTGATYFLLGATITVILFPRNIAALAILFLAFGDPVAAAVGVWKGRTKLWGRAWGANLACLATCMVIGAAMSLRTHEPALLEAEMGAVFGTLFQALPWRIDDNLTIPVGSAAIMLLTETILRLAGASF